MLEANTRSRIFELLSRSSPEVQKRIQAIQEGVGKLQEVPVYKKTLEGLGPNEVYEGNGENKSHFRLL